MTSYLKITGTYEEIDDLFENSHYISIRYFNNIGGNRWDITIRHSEHPDVAEAVKKARTAKKLKEIDTSRSFKN